jgi:uncharacterized protein with PQ loop repeat
LLPCTAPQEVGGDCSNNKQQISLRHSHQQQLRNQQQDVDFHQQQQPPPCCPSSQLWCCAKGNTTAVCANMQHLAVPLAAQVPCSISALEAGVAAGGRQLWLHTPSTTAPLICGASRTVVGVGVLLCLCTVSLVIPVHSVPKIFPVKADWGLQAGTISSSDRSSTGSSDGDGAGGVALMAAPGFGARAMQAGAQQVEPDSLHSIHSSIIGVADGSHEAATELQKGQIGNAGSQQNTDGAPAGIAVDDSSSSSSSSLHRPSGSVASSGDSDVKPERDWGYVVGTGIGYVSSVLYLMSRMSQIYKNWSRKSSEGLAIAMFMMAMCANLCTGTSILLRTYDVQQLLEQLPWVIGTLGTISLDCVILSQFVRYSSKGAAAGQAVSNLRHHQAHGQRHAQHSAVGEAGAQGLVAGHDAHLTGGSWMVASQQQQQQGSRSPGGAAGTCDVDLDSGRQETVPLLQGRYHQARSALRER